MVKDYIDTNDFTKEELLGMVDLGHRHEGAHQGGRRVPAPAPRTRPSA